MTLVIWNINEFRFLQNHWKEWTFSSWLHLNNSSHGLLWEQVWWRKWESGATHGTTDFRGTSKLGSEELLSPELPSMVTELTMTRRTPKLYSEDPSDSKTSLVNRKQAKLKADASVLLPPLQMHLTGKT